MQKQTVEFYNNNVKDYATKTLSIDVSHEREKFMSCLKPGAKLLDVGCGSGRDLNAFQSAGFEVVGVDGAEEMCIHARRHSGCKVYHSKFEDFTPGQPVDGIWAMASLVHTSDKDLPELIVWMWSWLKPGGVFFTCFKDTSSAGVSEASRFFNGFTIKELKRLFGALEGVEVLETWASDGFNTTWQNIILRKRSTDKEN